MPDRTAAASSSAAGRGAGNGRRAALAVTLVYALGGTLWILLSDLVISALFADAGNLVMASALKGLAFVVVTAALLYVLLRRAGHLVAPPEPGPVVATRWLAPALAGVMVVLVAVGALAVHGLVRHHEDQLLDQLESIAGLKAGQIARWLAERHADARTLTDDHLFQQRIGDMIRNNDPADRAAVRDRLTAFREAYHYGSITVLEAGGDRRMFIGSETRAHLRIDLLLTAARAGNGIARGEIYRDPDGQLHMDFVLPIPPRPGPAAEPVAFLLIHVSPEQFLFPFLQQLPMESASAETLLLHRDGDGVLFLNELRHRQDTALRLRIPFSREDVLAVQVAAGRVEPGQPITGTDYRGVEVVGVSLPIPGTDWHLIAKMDRAEILADLRLELLLLALALMLGLLAAAGAGLMLRQRIQLRESELQRREQQDRLRLEAEAARERGARLEVTRRYQTLVASSPLPLVSLDPKGRVLSWNAAAERTFGWTADEVKGRPYPVVPADRREEFDAQLAHVLGGKEIIDKEVWRMRRDGIRIAVRVSAAPVQDDTGAVTAIIVILQDVTEQQRMAADLRQSEERFRRAVLEAPFPIMIHAEDGEVQALSRSWTELTGYEVAELPTVAAWTALAYGEQQDEVRGVIDETYGMGSARSEGEFRVRCQDGSRRIWSFRSVSLGRLPDGRRLAISMAADITDRMAAEAELIASRRRLAVLMDNLPGIAYRGAEAPGWPMELLSAGCLALTGYRPEEITGGAVAFEELIHPDDRPAVRRVVETAAAGKPYELEYRIRTREGAERHVWEKGRCVSPPEEPQRWREGFIGDVTERRATEAALRASEQRFRSFVENANDIVYALSPEGIFTYVSPNWLDFLGEPADTAMGRSFEHYVHPEDIDRCRGFLKEVLVMGAKQASVEYRVRHADGSWVWHVSRGSPLRDADGRVSGYLGIARDVTDQKRAEVQLRKLSWAVEQSPASIVITNLDADIEYVNAAFVETTGYLPEDVLGRNPRILQSGKAPPRTYERMWAALAAGETWRGELHNRRKDGSEYYEFAIITPIRDPAGQVTHYLAVKEDITERKRVAAELDRHRHHLEELVAERTAQLQEARARADAANLAKSAFLANMSHEIRTPMNAIMGLTHLLQQDTADPEQAGRLAKIDASARHLLSIINDILDLSKIEAGKLVLERTDFHLSAVFDHVVSMVRDQAERKGLTLEVDTHAVPTWLYGDPARLRQALLNYTANAIKFTERGGVRLRAGLMDEHGDELVVRFEVEDTGIGVDPAALDQLFEPFAQAEGATSRHGGTGLGLTITRRLAQAMGGDSGATSVPGRGSTFWFTTRLRRGRGVGKRVPEPAPAAALAQDQQGARVLLAEDNAINREVAEALLGSLGLSVDSAENGRQALECMRRRRYDLVLMDVQMPEVNGLEATRLIRAMKGMESLPILAMTANVFEEDRRACEAAGMNDFLAKPVDPGALAAVLSRWLPRRSPSPEPVPDSAGNAPPSTALEAIDGLDADAGLRRLGGDVAAYERLLRRFTADHRETPGEIGGHLEAGKGALARAAAHALKGAAGSLGLVSIMDHARAVEAAAQEPLAASGALEHVDALERELRRLARALDGLEPAPPGTGRTPGDGEPEEVATRLRALLAADDTGAGVLFEDNRELLRNAYGEAIAELEAGIEAYDYPAALAALDALRSPAGDE